MAAGRAGDQAEHQGATRGPAGRGRRSSPPASRGPSPPHTSGRTWFLESAGRTAAVLPEPAEYTSHGYATALGSGTRAGGCGGGTEAPSRSRAGAARGCSETTCTVKQRPLCPPRLGGAGAQDAEPLTSLAGLRWRRRRGLALPRPARRRSAGVTAATPEAGLVRVVAGQRAGAGRSDSGLPAASAGGGAKRPRWVPAGARRRGPSAPKPAPREPRARPPPGPQRLSPTPGCLPALPARGRLRAPHRTLGDLWALTPPGFPYLCPPGPGRTPQLVRLPGLAVPQPLCSGQRLQSLSLGDQAVYVVRVCSTATRDPQRAICTPEEAAGSYWAVGEQAARRPCPAPRLPVQQCVVS